MFKSTFASVAPWTLGLMLTGMGLFASLQFFSPLAVRELVEADAKRQAQKWVGYFESAAPFVSGKTNTWNLDNIDRDMIGNANTFSLVSRFKLYSYAGYLVFDSDSMTWSKAGPTEMFRPEPAMPNGPLHNEKARHLLVNHQPIVSTKNVARHDGMATMVEVYLPVNSKGMVVGVAEVYLDQTDAAREYGYVIRIASYFSALLVALGLSIPAVGIYVQAARRRQAQEDLRLAMSRDHLTKAFTRLHFQTLVDQHLQKHADGYASIVLHFIDLDHFKDINDKHGHACGDGLLVAVCDRLRHIIRKTDLIGRYGGDELVVAQFDFPSRDGLESAMARVRDVFKEPFVIGDVELFATASIGTACGPRDGATCEDLISSADLAMYQAKQEGRARVCEFKPDMGAAKQRRASILDSVRHAIAQDAFFLHYQPIYSLQDRKLLGFEALLRLRDQHGAAISPADFIPIAEEAGLIDAIGAWVMQRACATATHWPKDLYVSVNVSGLQFKKNRLVETIGAALQSSGLSPDRLMVEVTESVFLQDAEFVLEQMKRLHDTGIAIALDDFGTGYSSLRYVLDFPINVVKIDRSFVKALTDNSPNTERAANVLAATINLCKTLGITVTSEGVETELQENTLRALGCQNAQGYLFGKPVGEADVASVILADFRHRVEPYQMIAGQLALSA